MGRPRGGIECRHEPSPHDFRLLSGFLVMSAKIFPENRISYDLRDGDELRERLLPPKSRPDGMNGSISICPSRLESRRIFP